MSITCDCSEKGCRTNFVYGDDAYCQDCYDVLKDKICDLEEKIEQLKKQIDNS